MQINLIYEVERRSASPVSVMLVVRLAAVVLLVGVGLGAFSFYVSYRAIQNQVSVAEADWQRTEPKYKAAVKVRNDLADQNETLNEIKGWRGSRIAWGLQLGNLQQVVPAVIQLTELRVSHTVLSLSNNISARAFELRVSGRTVAERSEANVVLFLEAFKQPPFSGFVQLAELPPGAFRQDPMSKSDRVFEIICKYVPRALE